MNLKHKVLILSAMVSFIVGCSTSTKNPYEGIPENTLYIKSQKYLNEANFSGATPILEELDNNHPFGPYALQVQLDLIYAYYKSNENALSVTAIDRFLKLNPTYEHLDWLIYLRGLNNMELEGNGFQELFNVDRYSRDPAYNKAAFVDFNYLTTTYPNSPYSYDAMLRMKYLKNQLAKHEYGIAKYLYSRGAYVAVVNRVSNMLSVYPDTQITKEALTLLKNAYKKLGLDDEAADTQQLIDANKVKRKIN